MKEKRYFCDLCEDWRDRIDEISSLKKVLFFILYLSCFLLVSVIGCIQKYGQGINTYSVEEYERLDEIADNVIKKGVGIDLSALPDDVVSHEKTIKDDEIIFEYCLDNNEGMAFAQPASMTIIFSKDFKIISRHPNFSSEEQYTAIVKILIVAFAMMLGGFMALVPIALIFIVGGIGFLISKKHKFGEHKNKK